MNESQEKLVTGLCRLCNTEMNLSKEQLAEFVVSGGICTSCSNQLFKSSDIERSRTFLEKMNMPVLLMQGEPRQVCTANQKALELFNKELFQVEGYRGGQVFDCVQSFTEAGCGKDVNCENCKIKTAIVDTFITGNSFRGVGTTLEVKKNDKTRTYFLQITTEKIGDLALIKIDRYQPT